MEIVDHILKGDNVKKAVWSKNMSGEFDATLPDTVIVHYTAGPYKASLNTLTNPKVRASAHLLVDRDGSVTQMVPFNKIAWHAGTSSYQGRIGFNKYSLGIEIVNSGPLTKSGTVFRAWYGASFNPTDVIEAIHRNQTEMKFWHVYTEEQIETVTELCRLFIDEYSVKSILGHEEIAPGRKTDPGPAFPLDRLRNQLLSNNRADDNAAELATSGRVIASKLNIRETPSDAANKVALPLNKGQKVKILDSANGWYKVVTEVEGWVLGKYIDQE
jgi:N-acetylmuramoyl-L-alanine amidase